MENSELTWIKDICAQCWQSSFMQFSACSRQTARDYDDQTCGLIEDKLYGDWNMNLLSSTAEQAYIGHSTVIELSGKTIEIKLFAVSGTIAQCILIPNCKPLLMPQLPDIWRLFQAMCLIE